MSTFNSNEVTEETTSADYIDADFDKNDSESESQNDSDPENQGGGDEHALATIANQHYRLRITPLEMGYYRARIADKYLKIGDRVYVTHVLPMEVTFVRHKSRYTATPQEFRSQFDWFPEGEQDYQREMNELLGFSSELQRKAQENTQGLRAFTPHVGAMGQIEGTQDLGTKVGSEIVLSQTPIEAKRQLARTQQSVAMVAETMQATHKQVLALAEEKAQIMKAFMDGMNEIVAKASEAIWTLNLYIGQDEEIKTLCKGEPAPPGTMLTLRQLVLFMDEECAVNAEQGGIDARSIEEFDEWLMAHPANLNQVFPEQKGVVCLKPKRFAKSYRDPWEQQVMNEANNATYFLIRNGENVYRMNTTFDVGRTMLPRENEFLEMFQVRKTNFVGGVVVEETTPLQPGTRAYMEAENRSDARGRHYFRMALILQGLIDRTPIFQPLEGNVRVTDPAAQGKSIHMINDAERALGDGRERFPTWLARINGKVDIGCRVVGFWRGIVNDNDETRIYPKNSKDPESSAIYTVSARRVGGFLFLYDRNYKGQDYYKTRASFTFSHGDKHWLNVDSAAESDMLYYMSNRLDRSSYMDMFPVLRRAIEVKREEELAEVPFRLLLVGEMMKAGAEHAEAESQVLELVRWWKFENRVHRALADEETKAVRMIVDEYRIRTKQRSIRAKLRDEGTHDKMVNTILAGNPDTLMIAHKSDGDYVSFVASNDENVFVSEQTWNFMAGLANQNDWKTVDNRFERWELLHTSERWNTWKIGESLYENATDPERCELLEMLKRSVPAGAKVVAASWGGGVNDCDKIKLFYLTEASLCMPSRMSLLTTRNTYIGLNELTGCWKRSSSRAVEITEVDSRVRSYGADVAPWSTAHTQYAEGNTSVIEFYPEVLEEWKSVESEIRLINAERNLLKTTVSLAFNQVTKGLEEKRDRELWEKFMAEYADPTLWEGYRKTVKVEQAKFGDLNYLLEVIVEQEHNLNDLTVAEMVTLYRSVPDQPPIPRYNFYREKGMPQEINIPQAIMELDIKIKLTPPMEDGKPGAKS